MSEPNELERLRADLDAMKHVEGLFEFDYQFTGAFYSHEQKIRDRIATLEAEADPWAKAREAAKLHLTSGGHNVKSVAEWAFHLEAKNAELQTELLCEQIDGGKVHADLKTRIAELEANAKTDANTIAGMRLLIEDYQVRPITPLDPKRVMKTANSMDRCVGPAINGWFDAEPYPLAGDDE